MVASAPALACATLVPCLTLFISSTAPGRMPLVARFGIVTLLVGQRYLLEFGAQGAGALYFAKATASSARAASARAYSMGAAGWFRVRTTSSTLAALMSSCPSSQAARPPCRALAPAGIEPAHPARRRQFRFVPRDKDNRIASGIEHRESGSGLSGTSLWAGETGGRKFSEGML